MISPPSRRPVQPCPNPRLRLVLTHLEDAAHPPLQTALDHGIQPSLSVDVECNMTADMFSIMRAAFTLQRALANERSLAGEQNLAPLLTCRQVIEMATIGGARVAHLDGK